jgi:L-lactate utilization protein LutC
MYGFSDSNTGSSASAYIDMSTGTLTLNSSKADCLHILSEHHVVVPSGSILRDSLSCAI